MIIFQSLTRAELSKLLEQFFEADGVSSPEKKARYQAKQLFHWVYQRFVTDFDEMTDLSKALRAYLKSTIQIYRLSERQSRQSLDGTKKFLWDLSDSKTIESVIIPAALDSKKKISNSIQKDSDSLSPNRLTACISSQVGCAMGCKFCLTGIQGFDRQLEVHEIVTQIYELRKVAPITNIVFMGMGEPLHNVDRIIKACEIFLDEHAFGFSKRKVTVSTSGLVPGIEKLALESEASLAVSLNASYDEQRSQIMPVNRRYPIQELLKACDLFLSNRNRLLTFEYVLLHEVNDSDADAKRVANLLKHRRAKVNLIPFNPHPGSEFKRPEQERVKAFQKILIDQGLVTTVRISRGRDILAACGQLRSIFGTAKGTAKHRDWKELPVVVSE